MKSLDEIKNALFSISILLLVVLSISGYGSDGDIGTSNTIVIP